MLIKKLKCGYYYTPVKIDNEKNYDDNFLNHLKSANANGDRLSGNYDIQNIDRMREYGFVYNKSKKDLVYMVGIQDFDDGIYRIESRLYVHPNYRKSFWKSPDNYETIKHQINNLKDKSNFLFKSREGKNTASFKISARYDNFFNDWQIYKDKIELKWKNNYQWIMYKTIKGNTNDYIKKIMYKI